MLWFKVFLSPGNLSSDSAGTVVIMLGISLLSLTRRLVCIYLPLQLKMVHKGTSCRGCSMVTPSQSVSPLAGVVIFQADNQLKWKYPLTVV